MKRVSLSLALGLMLLFCFSSTTLADQTTTTNNFTDWTYCSGENQHCSFSGTKEVRYGESEKYNYKFLTNGTNCTNAVFGDPIVGTVKKCYIRDVDTTAPTTTDNAPSDWVNKDVTVTFNASDSGSGVAATYYKVDNGAQQQGTSIAFTKEGAHIITYWSVDKAGNTETQHTATVKIDKTASITTDNIPTDWSKNDVTVNLTASDSESGVAATYYTVDGGTQQTGTTVAITEEGTHTIAYWSVDKAGNTETQHTATIKIDKTAPVTQASASELNGQNGWYISDPTVSLSAEDPLSGVAQRLYRINDGQWMNYTQPVTISTEGVNTFEYKGIDAAGNEITGKPLTIKLDKTVPTLKVALDKIKLWPPNGKLVKINATVDATDSISQIDSVVLTSITSNQTDNRFEKKEKENDIVDAEYGTLDASFMLRAKKSGKSVRVYTVVYTATDKAGNKKSASATVTVSNYEFDERDKHGQNNQSEKSSQNNGQNSHVESRK